MSYEPFSDTFVFSKKWTDPSQFPTVRKSATDVRNDMQSLHDEMAAGHNALVSALKANTASGNLGAKDKNNATSTIQAELNKVSNLGGVTATPEEINQLHGAGAVKADFEKLHGVTATPEEINQLHGAGAVKADFEKLHGITSSAESIDDAVSKKHTHSNKSVLDGITSILVSAWNAASTWVTTNGSAVLSHLANTTVHVTAADKSTWNGKAAAITANGILKGNGAGTVTAAVADTDYATPGYVQTPANIPGFSYTTSAPTAANNSGLKVVVLNAEPATKYSGWLYLITEA